MKRLVVVAAAALMVGMSASVAHAAVGGVLKTFNIPATALCGGITGGTAVALVNGSRVGVPASPILVVTSCIEAGQAKLFFIDPQTATVVKTINTSVTPTNGWGALAYRGDQADMIACTVTGAGTTNIHRIKINAFDTAVADGNTTVLRSAVPGSSCSGIAWDVNQGTGTVYQSPSTGTGVLKYTLPNGAISSVPSGCGATVAGVGIAGQSLFIACPPSVIEGPPLVNQVDKNAPNSLVQSFTAPTTTPVGLPDDPVSFGTKFLEALWTKDAVSAQMQAVEIPGGTSGQIAGVPVALPAACPSGYPTAADGTALDRDGDGLPDCWEDGSLWDDGLPGINFTGQWVNGSNSNTLRHLTLCVDANNSGNFGAAGSVERATECASPLHKDAYVELDFMQFHSPFQLALDGTQPAAAAIANVVAAFANAPVTNLDGFPGIRLHVKVDEQIPHADTISLPPCTPTGGAVSFDTLKGQFFGTLAERGDAALTKPALNARAFAYRYGILAHNQAGTGNTSTGCSEVGGNDFITTLGSWGTLQIPGGTAKNPLFHGVGSLDQQQGTLMHELGHTFGLLHGGNDQTNCKPNYLSVMSYSRQFSQAGFARPLDYSRQALPLLDENNLNEQAGIGGATGQQTMFGPPAGFPSKPVIANTGGAIDWNRSGVAGDATGVSQDISNMNISGCVGAGKTTLAGFDDWNNLKFNFRASLDFASGVTSTPVPVKEGGSLELELGEMLALSLDVIDFKPADPKNLIQTGSNQTVSVAIFSRGGDAPLDATTIDPATVTLRGLAPFSWVVSVKRANQKFACNMIDVNRDGLVDLQCQFDIPKNTIDVQEKTVILEGQTFPPFLGAPGQPVLSSDFIAPK